MTPEQQNLARQAIGHTLALYNNAGDRGRIDEVLDAFDADGTLDVPGASYGGHAAIGAFLRGVADGKATIDLRGARHHITTSRIEFTAADTAQGWTYFFVMRAGIVLEEGLYIDRFVARGGRWRIDHRRVKLLYTRHET